MNKVYHVPVLAPQCIEGLAINENGVYVDATFGGGGHSRLILDKLSEDGLLMVFDQDDDALRNIPKDKRVIPVKSNFKFIRNFIRYYDALPVDGILADLGISSYQIDEPERGFTYRDENAPLDMRMNASASITAMDILNNYDKDALKEVFSLYGELNNAGKIASLIEAERKVTPFLTAGQLNKVLEPFTPKQKSERAKFLAQVYQALRIEVNGELEALKIFLYQSAEVLRKGGRLVIIAYHSLEDRLVKNFMKTGNVEGHEQKDLYGNSSSPFKVINTKVIVPNEEEVMMNPRARSAKLRIAEKI